jgi:hypothetical protein
LKLSDKIETLEKQVQSLRSDLYETLLEIKASLPGGSSNGPQNERPSDTANPSTKEPRRRRGKGSKKKNIESVADGASTEAENHSDTEVEHPANSKESSQLEIEGEQEAAVLGEVSHTDKERLVALLEVYASAGILPHAAKDALYHIVTLNEASPPIEGGLSLWDCASVIPELNDAMIRGRRASEILGDVLPGNPQPTKD